MGRFVDLSRPITDEEREYLMSRSREGEVEVNDRQFGHLKPEEKEAEQDQAAEDHEEEEQERKAFEAAVEDADAQSFPEWIVDKVEPLTVNQLRTALAKRGLDKDGLKPDLQVRLAEWLEEQEKLKATEDTNG